MAWTCPVCRLHAPRISGKVRCRCGYFDANGTMQLRGLGDWLAKHLYRIGITPQRFTMLQFWRPLAKRRCRCKERQEALNTVSARVSRFIQRSIGHIQPRR